MGNNYEEYDADQIQILEGLGSGKKKTWYVLLMRTLSAQGS